MLTRLTLHDMDDPLVVCTYMHMLKEMGNVCYLDCDGTYQNVDIDLL